MRKFYFGHQLTDVQIIGGGIIGLSAALELRSAGLSVTVFEKGSIGRGSASWAGGGLLAPISPPTLDPLSLSLLARSLERYPSWCEELHAKSGIDPEYLVSGLTIHAPSDEQVWERYSRWAGAGWTRWPADGPGTSAVATRAIAHLPGVAQVRNPRLLKSLAGAARAAGVRILEGQRIRSLEQAGVVFTRTGIHRSKFTVLASGCWSRSLLREMRIKPVKGQMLLLDGRDHGFESAQLAGEHYLIPRRDGKVLAGSTLENAGFDTTVTSNAREQILSNVARISPGLASAPVLAQWAGLRPAPQGASPVIEWSRSNKSVLMIGGHYRLGLTLAPATAEMACRKILRAMQAAR